MRLLIAKCRVANWSQTSIWAYVWRLFSGISTTKATQEDILQELSNLTRQNRRKDISLTRVMFTAATSDRLSAIPCNSLELDPSRQDIDQYSSLASDSDKVTMNDFLPRKVQSHDDGSGTAKCTAQAVKFIREAALLPLQKD